MAYYHLKNCILKESEDELGFKLSSHSGTIELKLLGSLICKYAKK